MSITGREYKRVGYGARFLGASEDQVRWGGCDDPRGLMEQGQIYVVQEEEIHSYHTKLIFFAFPGKKFNSVCFEWVSGTGMGSRTPTRTPNW